MNRTIMLLQQYCYCNSFPLLLANLLPENPQSAELAPACSCPPWSLGWQSGWVRFPSCPGDSLQSAGLYQPPVKIVHIMDTIDIISYDKPLNLAELNFLYWKTGESAYTYTHFRAHAGWIYQEKRDATIEFGLGEKKILWVSHSQACDAAVKMASEFKHL